MQQSLLLSAGCFAKKVKKRINAIWRRRATNYPLLASPPLAQAGGSCHRAIITYAAVLRCCVKCAQFEYDLVGTKFHPNGMVNCNVGATERACGL